MPTVNVSSALKGRFLAFTGASAGAFSLVLPWPPSMNHVWRLGPRRAYLDQQAQTFRIRALAAVKAARISGTAPSEPLAGPVAVMLECFPPDRKRRDLDNVPKAVFDAMTKARVWNDGSQVQLMLPFWGQKAKGGRVAVTVLPLDVE